MQLFIIKYVATYLLLLFFYFFKKTGLFIYLFINVMERKLKEEGSGGLVAKGYGEMGEKEAAAPSLSLSLGYVSMDWVGR